jgi:hypothetical protein
MVVAITSVHPGCALHPAHPGCTSGYGDWWAGVLAGAGLARVVRPFSARARGGPSSKRQRFIIIKIYIIYIWKPH